MYEKKPYSLLWALVARRTKNRSRCLSELAKRDLRSLQKDLTNEVPAEKNKTIIIKQMYNGSF